MGGALRTVTTAVPVLWALAVNGADGVREFGVNLLADLDLTLALAGKRTLAGLGPEDLAVGGFGGPYAGAET